MNTLGNSQFTNLREILLTTNVVGKSLSIAAAKCTTTPDAPSKKLADHRPTSSNYNLCFPNPNSAYGSSAELHIVINKQSYPAYPVSRVGGPKQFRQSSDVRRV